MQSETSTLTAKKISLIFCFVFLLTGCSLMPGVKKQNDEIIKNPPTNSSNSPQADLKQEEIVNEEVVVAAEEGEEIVKTGNKSIKVFDIKANDNITSPVVIRGEGIAFENNLIVELRNNDHEALVKEFTIIKSKDVGEMGPYKITLHFEFSGTKEGFLAVYEQSAKDGSELNLVEIPVKFGNNETSVEKINRRKGEECVSYGSDERYKNLPTANEEYGYIDPYNSISLNLPYNKEWKFEGCEIGPFTQMKNGDGVILFFGQPSSWGPDQYELIIDKKRTVGEAREELLSRETIPKKEIFDIDMEDLNALRWHEYEKYDQVFIEVVGKEHNYRFVSSTEKEDELIDIIESLKFL